MSIKTLTTEEQAAWLKEMHEEEVYRKTPKGQVEGAAREIKRLREKVAEYNADIVVRQDWLRKAAADTSNPELAAATTALL